MGNEEIETEPKGGREVSETARREEEILAYWYERGIFEKSLAKQAPEGEFVFYDGPPFATGLPHMGHLLGSSIKDVVGRYKTMRGYRVPRRWGWDCHGLPIENIVEKKLGLKSKKDILALGVDVFNREAKGAVLQFVNDWKKYVERLGRWVDFDASYKTMDNSYIEAVWGALKKIHSDGRLYEGKKVLLYCPHCETPLSKAEIAMDNSYKEVTDKAVYVKFKLKSGQSIGTFVTDEHTYVIAWTTTPWTLPGNMALAINENIEYIRIEDTWIENEQDTTVPLGTEVPPAGKERRAVYVLASSRYEALKGHFKNSQPKVLETFKGSALVGLSYEPLYDIPKAKEVANEKTWTIQAADFVTTDEGTGIVHIAPMYGEDDYELGKILGFPQIELLDRGGHYNDDAPEFFRGLYYKKGGGDILRDLTVRGLVYKVHDHSHSYPHCYRCGTALIYDALSSWFIDIQSVKEKMLRENEGVHWYPEHLKEGRFKHIVEGAPDWTVSRNRFWASPLPIWKHEVTGRPAVLGSLSELRAHVRRSGNTYLMVRHGEAENNVLGVVSTEAENEHHLTERGIAQITEAAHALKGRGITKIISSPLVRTRETAERVAEAIGYSKDDIVYDARFAEWQLGELNGKPVKDIWQVCPTYEERFTNACAGGETLVAMKRRIGEVLYELERTYVHETILIVGHEYTLWMAECVARGADVGACVAIRGKTKDYVNNGEMRELDFVPLPHNDEYELDLHRPYIDDLPLIAEDGARLVRIPEVVDCWVESGLMPVSSEHALGDIIHRPANYPGDFIAEYIAQTRTWFYYMHAMGVLLFDKASFKHCVTTGTVLAEDGSKMSKSKGNFTDPLINIDRYGADALRLYLLGSVVMQAEDMSFKDGELKELHNRFINILWNTYAFYGMYRGEESEESYVSDDTTLEVRHVLDRWVLSRLHETTTHVTMHLDGYDTVRAVRTLRDFTSDLSTWYLRRSRERLKGVEGSEAQREATQTFRYVLLTLSKLLAPLAPFIAENVYRGCGGRCESVHLASWPTPGPIESEVLATMDTTRRVVSEALERRTAAGVKVRQPLATLMVPHGTVLYRDLVVEEVNVHEVTEGDALSLDTVVTPVLKKEGEVRELMRFVQELRKEVQCAPSEAVILVADTSSEGRALLEGASERLSRVANVLRVEYVALPESAKEVHFDELRFRFELRR